MMTERTMSGSPLKIGVMLDSFVVPAWIDRVFCDITTADFLELSLVILNGEKRDTSYAKRSPLLLFLLYEKVDQWLFSWRHSNAFAPKDISEHLSGVRIVTVLPSKDETRQSHVCL